MIEQLLCSAGFYALYKFLLEGRIPHRAARVYLITGAILAVGIPHLQLPIYPAVENDEKIVSVSLYEELTPSQKATESTAGADPGGWLERITRGAGILYTIVATGHLTSIAYRSMRIRRLRKRAKLTDCKSYTLAESEEVEEPFSFWLTIFLNYHYRPHEREQIIAHEVGHVRHHHTAERLTMEVLRALFWFNPLLRAMSSALIEVQEWEADREVLKQGYDPHEYRKLIFQQLFGYNPDIACGLKSKTSKKRFMMMTAKSTGRRSLMRLCTAIPLICAMILGFGAVRAEGQYDQETIKSAPTEERSKKETCTVEITKEGEIRLNGRKMNLAEFREELCKISETYGATSMLNIQAEAECEMGQIHDIKEAAREAGIYRIVYAAPEEALREKLNHAEDSLKAATVTEIRLSERNLLPILINAQGKILTRRADGDMGIVKREELKQIIKEFIDNSRHTPSGRKTINDHYSDFTWQTIPTDTEAGYERHYPVSNGVISIGTDRKTASKEHQEVEKAIREAYGELREELAQRSFQCSLSELNRWQKEFILKAIPLRVNEITPRE